MLFRCYLMSGAILLLLYTVPGCNPDKNIITPVYNSYTFDQKVIEKLPLYDSLAAAISKDIQVFLKAIDTTESYRAVRYMPVSNDPGVLKELPKELNPKILEYYNTLGSDFIFGFDLFKDSTIKIYIRRLSSDIAPVDIEENLAYYPGEGSSKKREFPVKDTVLNKHWQYWARFNKKGFF